MDGVSGQFTRSCSPPKRVFGIKNSVSSLPIYPMSDQSSTITDGKSVTLQNSISDGNIAEISESDLMSGSESQFPRDLNDLELFSNLRLSHHRSEATRDSTISGASNDEVFSNSPISRRVSCPVKVSLPRSISNDSLDKAYESSIIVDDNLSLTYSAKSGDDSELAGSSYKNGKRLDVPSHLTGSMSSLLSVSIIAHYPHAHTHAHTHSRTHTCTHVNTHAKPHTPTYSHSRQTQDSYTINLYSINTITFGVTSTLL